MTLEKIIYTIREVEKSMGLDSRYDDRMIIDMINRYRSVHIDNYFQANGVLKQDWFQSLGVITQTNVNSGDDSLVPFTSIAFGKYILPKTIEIPLARTIIIRSASKHNRIEEIDNHLLFKMIETEDELLRDFVCYFREQNVLYFYPVGNMVTIRCILENPLDGITYNQAVSGDGTVISPAGTRRNLMIMDEYPTANFITTQIILDILTKELGLEKRNIPDITVDGAETDNILKSQI